MPSIYIDSDNACGSPAGDVDDAFAIATLFASGLPIVGLGSVFGNTSEPLAATNNRALAGLCRVEVPILRGASEPSALPTEASQFLTEQTAPLTVVCLGPLTNLAAALTSRPSLAKGIKEVVIVGSNSYSSGRWPPLWPYEFNLTKDRLATKKVLASEVKLTVLPLNVARRFAVGEEELEGLSGDLGGFLRQQSRRWYRHLLWRRGLRRFPIYDLLAALYLIAPEEVELAPSSVEVLSNGCILHVRGPRPVQVVTGFDQQRLWGRFVTLVNGIGTEVKG